LRTEFRRLNRAVEIQAVKRCILKNSPACSRRRTELEKIRLTRGQVSLLPGVNEVTDDEREIMAAHPARTEIIKPKASKRFR
jgi:hypothetical protein